MRGFPIEPCPSDCSHPTAPEPCSSFVSQGFGPSGDYEHSLFCRVCGWELAEHAWCAVCGSVEPGMHDQTCSTLDSGEAGSAALAVLVSGALLSLLLVVLPLLTSLVAAVSTVSSL